MDISSRGLGVAALVLRVIMLGLFIASLTIIATAKIRKHPVYLFGSVVLRQPNDFTFKNRHIFRYVFSIATTGCAYSLLLIPLAAICVVKGKAVGGPSAAMTLIFVDVVFCALLSTGRAAGLGYAVDYQVPYRDDYSHVRRRPWYPSDDARRFMYLVNASCGLLLVAALCNMVVIMVSVYLKKQRSTPSQK